MTGNVLADLEISRFIGLDESGELSFENNVLDRVLDEERMMQFLYDNPRVANELVSYDGEIIYMGKYRNEAGMNYVSRSGTEFEGNNSYGIFLEKCRDRYIHEMKGQILEEVPVRSAQITVDFTQTDAEASDIEMEERAGSDKYIHVDIYRPARFTKDSDFLTGTSGHARRSSSSDVKFHTFECPFGLTRRHKILVGNAAEASMFYEQAIRGELDWKATFSDLRRRGLVKGVTVSEEQQLIADMKAQFAWMREQILRDSSLSRKVIVADGMVIPDKSMGRSVYHPEYAPSPAHILARYINNPQLLYTASENGVIRAIEGRSKDEAVRFSTVSGQAEITIVVDGSDTIGGRVPGTRAVSSKKQVAVKDESGRITGYEMKKVNEFMFKTDEETKLDYAAFSDRMDSILMNLAPDVKVRFVSGTNVGTDKMLMKYVSEKGGNVYDWNYTLSSVKNANGHKNKEGDNRLSVIRMQNFSTVYPVLVGRQDSVRFNLSAMSDDTEVEFSSRHIIPDGFISYSVGEDNWNRFTLERGSLAAATGKPFLHILDNSREEEQLLELELSSESTKYSLLGEPSYQESLFNGETRMSWDLNASSVMSHMPSGPIDIAIPFVANNYDASVYVNGVPFSSVYGTYCALVMKNTGISERQAYHDLAQAGSGMISMQNVFERYTKHLQVSDDVKEKCMRNAVHMMTRASSRFTESILNTGESDIVCVSSFGDASLFTGIDGQGENRFGIVMMSERVILQKELELSRLKDEAEVGRIAEKIRRNENRMALRAPAEKIVSGLPRNMEETMNGIWFLGTCEAAAAAFPEGGDQSFVLWEEGYNQDILNREKASRPYIEDVEGNRISNDFVFFFPTSLTTLANRYPLTRDPNHRDLTGVTRINSKTGEEYVCAYGIAVKRNREFYEHDNKFGKSCSFLLDNDNATLANSIYAANAEARATALRHNLALCYSAYSTKNGNLKDSLSKVFEPKVYDYERTKEVFDRNTGRITQEGGVIIPKEISVRRYNKETKTYETETKEVREKTWIDNPHAAPKNLQTVKKFESMLQNGMMYPLTCFRMPRTDYDGCTSEEFMADLMFSLNMANATALATGRSLRFPLDAEGRINLGPGVPEEFREKAEKRIDEYIGVIRDESIADGKMPVLNRIPISKAFSKERPLEKEGSYVILRPNDLLAAFGRYNFQDILVGNKAPLHEMAFQDENGNLYKITDPRFASQFTQGEINKYLRYDKNDNIRWNIRSSNPTRIPAFIQSLKSYISRAEQIQVEYRLFSEDDCQKGIDGITDLSMKGFVHLLASNEDNYELYDSHVISARPNETMLEMDPDWINVRGRQGREDDQTYAGKEIANDGFKGWAMFRYRLPDGKFSDWKTVDDLEFAKDIILTSTKRVYKTDTRILPSEKVIEANLRSLAVKDCGNMLFDIEVKRAEVKADDKIVKLPDIPEAELPSAKEINVHFGRGDNPELSNFAERPFDFTIHQLNSAYTVSFRSVEQAFQYMKVFYSQCSTKEAREYKDSILATFDGKKLRELGRNLSALDVEAWSLRAPDTMKDLIKASFEQNPQAREALLATGEAKFTHHPDDSRWGELFPEILADVRRSLAIQKSDDILFTESAGGYQKRTYENAQADEVDFTLAFATDFSTYGEKCTAKAAGDSLISVNLQVKQGGGLDLSQNSVKKAVDSIIECLPDEYINGYDCGLNIAGNGIYTLAKEGIVQEDLDIFMCAVGKMLQERGVSISSVRSGGQTGMDEAGAAMGKALGIPTTVHAPHGWSFRGSDGKDINDRDAFVSRFNRKDYKKIASMAEDLNRKDSKKSRSSSVKIS